jgi:hypothetical protein
VREIDELAQSLAEARPYSVPTTREAVGIHARREASAALHAELRIRLRRRSADRASHG